MAPGPRGRARRAMLAHDVSVNVAGEAKVDQTLHLDVSIGLDGAVSTLLGELRNSTFSIPLLGSADTGRMDTDAAPNRHGGIGHN